MIAIVFNSVSDPSARDLAARPRPCAGSPARAGAAPWGAGGTGAHVPPAATHGRRGERILHPRGPSIYSAFAKAPVRDELPGSQFICLAGRSGYERHLGLGERRTGCFVFGGARVHEGRQQRQSLSGCLIQQGYS